LFVNSDGSLSNSSSSDPVTYGENLFISAANYRGLTLNTTTASNRPTVAFRNTNGAGAIAYIQGDGKDLVFGRANSDYGGQSESLRITSTGALNFVGAGTAGSTQAVSFNGSAPVNSLVIDSSGRVGLGTSSPATAFEIQGNQPQITIDTTTTGYTALLFATNGVNDGGIYYNGTDDRMEVYTADTSGNPQAVIDSSGRVGIGTTTPRQALTFGGLVSTSTATPDCIDLGATYTSTSASTNLKLKLYIDSSGNTYGFTTNGNSELEYYAGTVSSPGKHVFLTGGSERARITSSGQLLVGTSSDSGGALLQVNGDRVRIATAKTPASASDTGTTGEICWDANYVYVCTATNTWKRSAISTW
jgi:hypothetical protein